MSTTVGRPLSFVRLVCPLQDGDMLVTPTIPTHRMSLTLSDYLRADTLGCAFDSAILSTPNRRIPWQCERISKGAALPEAGLGKSSSRTASSMPLDVADLLDTVGVRIDLYFGLMNAIGLAQLKAQGCVSIAGMEQEYWAFSGLARSVGADDGGVISVEAEDYSGALQRADVPQAVIKSLSMSGKPETLIDFIISSHPTFGQSLGPTKVLGGIETPTLESVASALARPEGGKGGRIKYWDLCWSIAALCGLILIMDRRSVYLAEPRTWYYDRQDQAAGLDLPETELTPPAQRRAEASVRWLLREGRQERIHLMRQFEFRQRKVVEVRCYVPEDGRVLVGRYPDPATADRMGLEQGGDILLRVVRGLTSQESVDRIARRLWDAQVRAGLTGTVTSMHPALLPLRPGYPVGVWPTWLREARKMRANTVKIDYSNALNITVELGDWTVLEA